MSNPFDKLEQRIGAKLNETHDHEESVKVSTLVAAGVADAIHNKLTRVKEPRSPSKLWASDLGQKCQRQLWYELHNADAEPYPAALPFKYMYGTVIEEMVLGFLPSLGHKVELPQYRVEHTVELPAYGKVTISGRIDAIVDGVLVDVKSCSTRAFDRYTTEGVHAGNDSFGYRGQLNFYYHELLDGKVIEPHKPGFLFVDKTLGHMKFVPIVPSRTQLEQDIREVVATATTALAPAIKEVVEPEGKSGNYKLSTVCSYCPYKGHCWDYKTYLYSTGPKYLTRIVKEPNGPPLVPNTPLVPV